MNMTGIAFLASAALLSVPVSASAHRLDEYLQATTIGLARDHILLHLRLTPGVDVADGVIHQIDRNGDGVLSSAEQHSYVAQIAQTLSLSLNGQDGHLLTDMATFPSVAAMKAGTGVIDLQFRMKISLGSGTFRLAYRNRGAGPDTVWLVNCLLPQDPALHVLQQKRSEDQSSYVMDFSVEPS